MSFTGPRRDQFPRASLAVEEASEGDRVYFERNANATIRRRAMVEGEFGPHLDSRDVVYVEVHQLAPGVRVRKPLTRQGEHA